MPSANADTFDVNTPEGALVLLLTHDDILWERWRRLGDLGTWAVMRGTKPIDLSNSSASITMLDAELPGMPEWSSPEWNDITRRSRVLVASTVPDRLLASAVIQSGCSGCIHAYSPTKTLSTALLAVYEGSIWLGRDIVSGMLHATERLLPKQAHWASGLTTREREVAQRAARGETNQEIADALGITERTVRAHLSAIFQKLQVSDRLSLALRVHGIK